MPIRRGEGKSLFFSRVMQVRRQPKMTASPVAPNLWLSDSISLWRTNRELPSDAIPARPPKCLPPRGPRRLPSLKYGAD